MSETINKDKLSLIRKYPLETLVTLLIAGYIAIAYYISGLTGQVNSLQNSMTNYLSTDRVEMLKAIERSNNAIDNNTKAFERFLINDKK
jgi:hypothetical protein